MFDVDKLKGSKRDKQKLRKLIDSVALAKRRTVTAHLTLYKECRKLQKSDVCKRLVPDFSKLLKSLGVSVREYGYFTSAYELLGSARLEKVGWLVARWIAYYTPSLSTKKARQKIAVDIYKLVEPKIAVRCKDTISNATARQLVYEAAKAAGVDVSTQTKTSRADLRSQIADLEAQLEIAIIALKEARSASTKARMHSIIDAALAQLHGPQSAYWAAQAAA